MLAGKKQDPGAFEAPAKPQGTPPADALAAGRAADAARHVSPARALQQRLARELGKPARSWLWHSAGLVLAAILAMWMAPVLLYAGF
ncbi:hypothetical protein [Hyphomonas sp.]|uniref:hypothetical protein n=1 Tax=Hyphomonas sp. TaxID=87 RepID=UPI00391C628C